MKSNRSLLNIGYGCGLVLLLAAFGSVADWSPAVAEELQVGDAAPKFNLMGSDGKTYQLDDFIGRKPVVICWFPKAFTGGCTKECTSLRDQGAALRELDVAFFAASVDTAAENQKFAESLSLDFPILSDPDKKLAQQLGVLGKRGVAQRWTYIIGTDGQIKAILKKVDVESHGRQVADKIKELGLTNSK